MNDLSGPSVFQSRLDAAAASEADFLNQRLEYRRLFSELWGTFLLVMVAAGGGVIIKEPFGSGLLLPAIVLAPGMMVMAIIFFMGTISGAHLNPAVTLAFAVRGNFPWKRVPGYIVAQFFGALFASLFLQWMFGNVIHGATLPAAGISGPQAAIMEAVLTLGLVSVILGTATGARNIGVAGAIAVGSYIGLVVVWAAPVTGASMNPIRSLGPALVGWDFTNYWVYVVGPIAGAMLAVLFEFILRGKATEAGAYAAQGRLSGDNPAAL